MLNIILGCCTAAFPIPTAATPNSLPSSLNLLDPSIFIKKVPFIGREPLSLLAPNLDLIRIYLESVFSNSCTRRFPALCSGSLCPLLATFQVKKKKQNIFTFSCIFNLSLSTDIFLHLSIFICLRHSHLWHKTK